MPSKIKKGGETVPMGSVRTWAPEQVAELIALYVDHGYSMRDLATRFDRSFSAVQRCLYHNNVDVRPSLRPALSVEEHAARDGGVRRLLLALRAIGEPVHKAAVDRVMGRKGSTHHYVGLLLPGGYVTVTGGAHRRYVALTPKGAEMLANADVLYAKRQPAALARRQQSGESIEDIASDVGLRAPVVVRLIDQERGCGVEDCGVVGPG